MKLRHIIESPIRDLEISPTANKDISLPVSKHEPAYNVYKKTDFKPLENKVKIFKAFEKTKRNFNFYFVYENDIYDYFKHAEKYNRRNFIDILQKHIHKDINLHNAITVIFTNNMSDNRIPFTSWILAHRTAHAIQVKLASGQEYAKGSLKAIIPRQISMLQHYLNKTGPINSDVLYNFVDSRAGRNNKIRNFFDLEGELLAQYLLLGKVKFKRFKKENTALDYLERDIEKEFDKVLDSLTGDILLF